MGKQLIGTIKGAAGESAYQIAVRHGFLGTEQEWLDAIDDGNIIDPVTKLPSPPVLEAWTEAIIKPHEEDPTPHTAYDGIDMLTAYRLGKI